MNIILFDTPHSRNALLPFSAIRPLATLRLGIYTILEKWQKAIPGHYSFATEPYLSKKFPSIIEKINLCINGSICPSQALTNAITSLQAHQFLHQDDTVIAFWADELIAKSIYPTGIDGVLRTKKPLPFSSPLTQLNHKWDIFLANEAAIREDFQYIQAQKVTRPIQDPYTLCYNPASIFVEAEATLQAAVLNAEKGPIYIGPGAVIEERAVIKGPVAICRGAQVKVNSCLYGGTTIGPYAKVGGEVYNSVIFEYANKAHGGFLGNAVIGSWCNIGAYTTSSNLRNDYDNLQVWDMAGGERVKTELQFCGVFLGDYSKCGIHTMFNTATVVGMATNLFGTGFFHRFIPSFAKGSPPDQLTLEKLEKIITSISYTMARRNQELSITDRAILTHVYSTHVGGPLNDHQLT